MIPIKMAILRHILECETRAIISGPKALATLSSIIAAFGKDGTQDAVKELHMGQFIAVQASRTRSAHRFVLTESGKMIVEGRVAA